MSRLRILAQVSFCRSAVVIASLAVCSFFVVSPSRADDLPAKPADNAKPDAMWAERVEPILKKNCFGCHGADKKKGGLDLRSLPAMLVGGTDGAVVVPGRPAETPLLQRVQSEGDDRMPPEKGKQLSAEDILTLTQWVSALGKSASAAGQDWTYEGPSLLELATRTKWTPPEGMTPSAVIDHLIQATWKSKQIAGGELCDDATFVRRLYLDLAGRIPTEAEAEAFVQSTDAAKRTALVDQLLSGSDYPQHMAELLDVALLSRKGKATEAQRKSGGWLAYLQRSLAANRPWNVMVKDLIVARPAGVESQGAQWFLYEQKNNHQQMAEAIAPVAFGVAIDCAQCHNHPLAHEIKQKHYWGLVAAFNRTTNADTDDGPALSESAVGGFVNFTNLKKDSQPAILSLLNNKVVDEARPAEGAKEDDADANYLVPPDRNARRPRVAAIPKVSRRQIVAEAIVADNPLLARAFVNRVWALLLGRGLVHPVNEMDSRHAPSHPELLSWLAQDFESTGYDIKRLIRNIVLSRTYQLQARTGGESPPAPEPFACSLEKPLTAEVLYRSLLVATGNPAENTDELRQALVTAFPGVLAVEYNATLQQSAFLTNSPLIDKLLKPAGTNLTARLLAVSTPEQRVRGAFSAVLGRAPAADELTQSLKYLEDRQDRPEVALRHLEWALLASPEFLLNH